jgi:oligopeptide transport system substrate-binding protein
MRRSFIITAVTVILLFAGARFLSAELPTDEFLRVSFSGTKITFNPLHTFTSTEAQLYTALYEGLVTYHPLTMEPVPAAASRWEISEDKTTYWFFLRETGRYWNGDPVTAADFKDTWLTLLDPDEESEYSFLFDIIEGAADYRTGKNTDPASVGIRAVDTFILEVQLEHPAGHFLKVLCHHSFAPVHPRFLDREDWSISSIIPGNGPYYVYSQNPERIVLVKNNLYWNEAAVDLPGIVVRLENDAEAATRAFNEGELAWVADSILLDRIDDTDSLVFNPLFATTFFYFSCREAPFDDPRVRRALTLLLPFDSLRSPRFMYFPASTLVPGVPKYPQIFGITEQDTDESARLLEEAGFPGGEGIPEIIIKIPGGFESRRVAVLMKQRWEESLGLTVNIEEFDFSRYYDVLKAGDYTLGMLSWIGDFPDPLTFLQMWTSESNLNDAGYRNPHFDAIIGESMLQSGVDRYETLSRAEQLILDEAVVLPISHLPAWNLIDLGRIEGWYPNPLDIHPFRFIRRRKLRVGPGIVFLE